MSDRSTLIPKLLKNKKTRTAYIKAKLGVVVPSQIRALRLKSDMPRQADLALAADMQQSRISMFETPGAANLTLETLSRLAAVFKVGLVVKFVAFSEMLRWENTFSQDGFDVIRLNEDRNFLNPPAQRTLGEWAMKSFENESQESIATTAQTLANPNAISVGAAAGHANAAGNPTGYLPPRREPSSNHPWN